MLNNLNLWNVSVAENAGRVKKKKKKVVVVRMTKWEISDFIVSFVFWQIIYFVAKTASVDQNEGEECGQSRVVLRGEILSENRS